VETIEDESKRGLGERGELGDRSDGIKGIRGRWEGGLVVYTIAVLFS
jgi:hypothetical protein